MDKNFDNNFLQPKIVSHQPIQFETDDHLYKPGENPSDGNNGWGNG
ncbi:hypothetical protein [Sporolactobacillus spathodeae]|uniref:Paeninodin family lasso peptide n=1 Tax=Sporolactobacillus spathodeae TaxID=1465502 RepID=A0ABS2QBK0_9BACL|nr:hypothetical protein [Sporolactobacillus spathodeae]MBM7659140.1 hypothetical protein [Sporolactobacillus spathodeae]